MAAASTDTRPILVTGATGYVGGRLVPYLLERGHRVRAMARSISKLGCRPWASHENVELAQADVLDIGSLRAAAKGCRAVVYLIHSMNPKTQDFAAADRAAARHMLRACEEGGVDRIIYLGGLIPKDVHLSHHLQSRAEVAEILGSGRPSLTSLHAAQILGAGSASFELIRYLAEHLPVMVTPRWVRTEAQPIAIRDVLAYLAGCLEHEETAGRKFDIGGPDILTYEELFQMYAEEAGLSRRLIIPVPFLTPLLSSYWIGLVTPIQASLARPLILGLRNRAVCEDDAIRSIIPLELAGCRETIHRALERVKQHAVDTCWSDAGDLTPPEWVTCGDAPWAGGDVHELGFSVRIQADPDEVWPYLSAVGGDTGWYVGDFLWKLRGAMDVLIGGVGTQRGRRHPTEIRTGDALDFWRVVAAEPGQRLTLLAEMTTPGEALLDFSLHTPAEGETLLLQRSRFLPHGLVGHAYWWFTYPMHVYIFKGMLRQVAKLTGKPVLAGPDKVAPGSGPTADDACALRL